MSTRSPTKTYVIGYSVMEYYSGEVTADSREKALRFAREVVQQQGNDAFGRMHRAVGQFVILGEEA